jgi:uncharacterized protein YbjT (DUF2867 family)
MDNGEKTILVTGATGRQGGAAARHLLKDGWSVRALTRNPDTEKAKALKELGADVIKGDLNRPEELKHFFEDIFGVFSVQNPWVTRLDKETEHGIAIADLAAGGKVKHLVYSSAGPGKPGTGVPHFDSKLKIEEHIRGLGVPYTILRPAGFMELMKDKDFVPPLVAWNVTEKVLGKDFPLTWVACDDIGAVAAKVFASPGEFAGKDVVIAGDRKSMAQCREIYRSIHNKIPFRIPAPVWLFKVMQKDLWKMYQWMLRDPEPDGLIDQTRKIHPGVMDVETWMRKNASV